MKAARLTDEQKLDWLQLIRCENIGPRTFLALIQRHGDAGAALRALPELIRQGRGRPVTLASRDMALREWERAARLGARFIALCEPDFPPALRAIDAPPPLIAVRGDAGLLRKPMVALVGSRNASAAGLAMTERLGLGLGAAGYAVVSGAARGIDACAHKASLPTGAVGVLAGGLDRPYPPENLDLLEDMAARGVVISEMPFGYEPRGRDFPRRNRIVSGLSLATVVVEAARRSGSLITARFAQEQGREVFAVPGSPLDPRAAGALDLIRDGALLCMDAQDVIDVVAPLAARGAARYDLLFEPEPAPYDEPLWDEWDGIAPAAPLALEFVDDELDAGQDFKANGAERRDAETGRERVERLLGPAPIGVDDLARASGFSVQEIRLILQELEIEGRIERHGGDRVALIG
ncbi:DNA-processing protein DprA [Rhodoblastus acidophilus]|uniref:DNA-processing protein DprA n=1 Tax=Candidatus Rhodoblastus alkanivorans TaxID=2954117 RepID=A0ABS9ZA58_9HYPH|nr:DNA-processing protein DprA [Candidatus Rhodoblastus alkanivorans]MCI4679496.1 DNA-processing protein DprA [Candidatus Rhodoblastus alkanivorans]MCI4683941.1 DNA-processing protein DprA [Candidatus Rhodoblastus alkanivorans]MDI4641260.1 DNA-processing protein DprA [Rhodoblastus acidophilus]